MTKPKHILIAYTDTGGGHRATARAIASVLSQNTSHRITFCNPYRDISDDLDLFAKLTGYKNEEVYNRFVLGKNWHRMLCLMFYGFAWINAKWAIPRSIDRFKDYCDKIKPDIIISVMPFINSGIYDSIQKCKIPKPIPFLVVITDLVETFPYSWFPRQQDYHIACGTEDAYKEAIAKPHPQLLTHKMSGLPVHPAFYQNTFDREDQRFKDMGFASDGMTGCMMYGSAGSPRMIALAKHLQKTRFKGQMIFLCGNNPKLEQALAALALPFPHAICGFTENIPFYFSVADFLVCKPGPGTVSEGLVAGPQLLIDCQNVLPQERYNVKWIRKNRMGHTFETLSEFTDAMQNASNKTIATRKIHAIKPTNQAIFEIRDLVHKLLSEP